MSKKWCKFSNGSYSITAKEKNEFENSMKVKLMNELPAGRNCSMWEMINDKGEYVGNVLVGY